MELPLDPKQPNGKDRVTEKILHWNRLLSPEQIQKAKSLRAEVLNEGGWILFGEILLKQTELKRASLYRIARIQKDLFPEHHWILPPVERFPFLQDPVPFRRAASSGILSTREFSKVAFVRSVLREFDYQKSGAELAVELGFLTPQELRRCSHPSFSEENSVSDENFSGYDHRKNRRPVSLSPGRGSGTRETYIPDGTGCPRPTPLFSDLDRFTLEELVQQNHIDRSRIPQLADVAEATAKITGTSLPLRNSVYSLDILEKPGKFAEAITRALDRGDSNQSMNWLTGNHRRLVPLILLLLLFSITGYQQWNTRETDVHSSGNQTPRTTQSDEEEGTDNELSTTTNRHETDRTPSKENKHRNHRIRPNKSIKKTDNKPKQRRKLLPAGGQHDVTVFVQLPRLFAKRGTAHATPLLHGSPLRKHRQRMISDENERCTVQFQFPLSGTVPTRPVICCRIQPPDYVYPEFLDTIVQMRAPEDIKSFWQRQLFRVHLIARIRGDNRDEQSVKNAIRRETNDLFSLISLFRFCATASVRNQIFDRDQRRNLTRLNQIFQMARTQLFLRSTKHRTWTSTKVPGTEACYEDVYRNARVLIHRVLGIIKNREELRHPKISLPSDEITSKARRRLNIIRNAGYGHQNIGNKTSAHPTNHP